MKVIVLGANGQLGNDLVRTFRAAGDSVVPITRQQIDVRCQEKTDEVFSETRPDVVINTAAFHKVEECEKNPALAFEVNGCGPKNLAVSCTKVNAVLVHYSTDYVFDGRSAVPYTEQDLPSPVNVYGASKVAGEHLIASGTSNFFVVRTSGLYGIAGSSGKGGNFVENILKRASAGDSLRIVDDQILTPTYTVDLAQATRELILRGQSGTYHISSEGYCSWYEFARQILQEAGINCPVVPVRAVDFPSTVRRPAFSVLAKMKYQRLGLAIPDWQDALSRYLRERSMKEIGKHC